MLRLLPLLAIYLLLVGCGPTDGRLRITGEVSFDGQPIKEGYVTFDPVGDGPSAGGRIQNGKFTIAGEKGPKTGKYRILIEAHRETGRMIPIDPAIPEDTEAETEQFIPARFNTNSEIEVDLSPEQTDFVWELTSQEAGGE